ncbi:MAG: response regulator transcription factor [Actinomycetota bacterium]
MNDTMAATVLIAEDDPEIRTALERILTYEGYSVVGAGDGAAALGAVAEHEPDALVLDVMMPHVDGLAVCRQLRRDGNRVPILMLTARQETADKVAGLDAGADDYLAKPFEMEELLARLRALLRRVGDNGGNGDGEVFQAGPLTLDLPRRLVTVTEAGGGAHTDADADTEVEPTVVDLTRTEFAILELLFHNLDIVLERSVMYERIWGYDFDGESRSLDVHVGYLRRKLEAAGTPRLIETVRGVGFVLRDGD